MKKTQGFTIVELLIVVVVIAILAAITIVSYNGITLRAKESSLKADLTGGAKLVELKKTTEGTYPADLISSGIKASSGNTITYSLTQNGYCIAGNNGSLNFKITQHGNVSSGICERAWVSKGSAGPSCGATCFYAVLNTSAFTAGNYNVRCIINGSPTTYTNRAVAAYGTLQLSCYNGAVGVPVLIEVQGWGVSETLTW